MVADLLGNLLYGFLGRRVDWNYVQLVFHIHGHADGVGFDRLQPLAFETAAKAGELIERLGNGTHKKSVPGRLVRRGGLATAANGTRVEACLQIKVRYGLLALLQPFGRRALRRSKRCTRRRCRGLRRFRGLRGSPITRKHASTLGCSRTFVGSGCRGRGLLRLRGRFGFRGITALVDRSSRRRPFDFQHRDNMADLYHVFCRR